MRGIRHLLVLAVAAAALPAPASDDFVVLTDAPDLYIVERRSPDAPLERLTVRLVSDDAGEHEYALAYSVGGFDRLAATLWTAPGRIGVLGTSDQDSFAWDWRDRGGDGVTTRFRYGRAWIEASVTEIGTDASFGERYARYREAVEHSAGWPIVESLDRFVQGMDPEAPATLQAGLVTYGAGGTTAPRGPIGDYLDCLRSSCSDCGGCWDEYPWADCFGCEGQTWLEQGIALTCYVVSTYFCLKELISSLDGNSYVVASP